MDQPVLKQLVRRALKGKQNNLWDDQKHTGKQSG